MQRASAKPELDKQVVEAAIRQFGPISRAGIHEIAGIRPSATSQIVRQLLSEGRVVEAGVEQGRLGRKGVLLRLNEQFGYVAAVEFDDETVVAGITDLGPRLTQISCVAANLDHGTAGLVRQLVDTVRKAIRESGINPHSLVGIGVADPGLVDSRRGVTVTSSTIGFWKDVPLKEIFEREFGLPVLVETRTRAKTVAERKESGDDAETMIYIDYGTGIGAGLYVDGRLLYGQGSAAGEFGHTHIVEDGPACNCGSFGCLEAIAGMRAVEARLRRAVADGGQTELIPAGDGDPSQISGWMVLEAAGRGDKISINIIAEVGRYLGLGIANMVNLFNPSVVVLDASLRSGGQQLLDQITAIVRRQALRESVEQVQVRYARLSNHAGVLGVAAMVLEKHFEIPSFKVPAVFA
ncbi:MAG: ROK family protein [Bryobacterales bacterium]|nr:ROK family protein [Bryobacterales bacterium]